MLSLNFLTAEKEEIAAKRHWIIKAFGLNQPIYLINVLTSKWKSKDVLLWGRGYVFISTGNERT